MYETDGLYGKVRIGYAPGKTEMADVLDRVTNCGWHRCNELYMIMRNPLPIGETLLMLTVDGTGELMINGKRHILRPRTLAIAPLNRGHSYYTQSGGKWEFYWMHVRGDNCSRILEYIVKNFGFAFETPDYPDALRRFENIINAEYRYLEYEIHTAAEVQRLLFSILRYQLAQSRKCEGGRKAFVAHIMDYIENNVFQQITVEDIAKSLYVSSEHVIRAFKKEIGQTPYQYIKKRRIAHARRLLVFTNMNVNEIAESIGYRSASAFCAQFRESCSMTPAEYRASISKN